jgi:hypothetical protein
MQVIMNSKKLKLLLNLIIQHMILLLFQLFRNTKLIKERDLIIYL